MNDKDIKKTKMLISRIQSLIPFATAKNKARFYRDMITSGDLDSMWLRVSALSIVSGTFGNSYGEKSIECLNWLSAILIDLKSSLLDDDIGVIGDIRVWPKKITIEDTIRDTEAFLRTHCLNDNHPTHKIPCFDFLNPSRLPSVDIKTLNVGDLVITDDCHNALSVAAVNMANSTVIIKTPKGALVPLQADCLPSIILKKVVSYGY